MGGSKSKFNDYYKPSHKVNVLKARVYKLPNQNSISNYFLPFSSEIEIIKKDKNFVKVEKNMWIKQSCIISKNKKRKDYKKIYKLLSSLLLIIIINLRVLFNIWWNTRIRIR